MTRRHWQPIYCTVSATSTHPSQPLAIFTHVFMLLSLSSNVCTKSHRTTSEAIATVPGTEHRSRRKENWITVAAFTKGWSKGLALGHVAAPYVCSSRADGSKSDKAEPRILGSRSDPQRTEQRVGEEGIVGFGVHAFSLPCY